MESLAYFFMIFIITLMGSYIGSMMAIFLYDKIMEAIEKKK